MRHAAQGSAPHQILSADAVVRQFTAAWRSGRRPSLARALAESADRPDFPELALRLGRVDLNQRLLSGDDPPVHELLNIMTSAGCPLALEARLELIHLEYQARWRRGEPGVLRADYADRYPEHCEAIGGWAPRWDCPTCGREDVPLPDEAAPTATCPNPRCPAPDHPVEALFRVAAYPGGDRQDYRFDETADRVGVGGMGAVYRTRDPALNRTLAIKVIHRHLLGNRGLEWRFAREARLTARLEHPNIVPVHGVGRLPDGRLFYTMKLVQGVTLRARLADLGDDPTARLNGFLVGFEQVCLAVGFAHAKGIVHRDLKPDNVMVGEFGEVQVMDWGLAKRLEEVNPPSAVGPVPSAGPESTPPADGPTLAGQFVGTPLYASPEQFPGSAVTIGRPADVFALGAILCEMLTGLPPYLRREDDPKNPTLVARIAERVAAGGPWPGLARLAEDGPAPELAELAGRCLAAHPADRPPDGATVAAAVAVYRAGVDARLRKSEAERAAAGARVVEHAKRRKVQAMLAGAVGLLLAGGGGFAWWSDRQAEQRKTERAEADAEQARLEGERKAEQARFDAEQARVALERKRAKENARLSIDGSLKLADGLRRQYRFREAGEALDQAAKVLSGGLADDLRTWVERAQADLAFVRRLDAIRTRKLTWVTDPGGKGRFDRESAPPAYLAAFRDRGFDVTAGPVDALAGRVAASAVRAELLAALDDWATGEPDADLAGRLLAVARAVDSGPWLDRFRDPAVRRNPDELTRLAEDADVVTVSPSALVALADLLDAADRNPTDLLELAQLRHPTDFPLALGVGQAYFLRDAPDRSLGFLRAAQTLRPDNTAVLDNIGAALDALKETDAAIRVYREAVRLDPNFMYGFLNLGNALRRAKRPDEAVAAFRDAIRIDPNYPDPHSNLGACLLEDKDDLDGAEAEFREAVRVAPGFAPVHVNLGYLMFRRGDFAGAEKEYREAVRLGPRIAGTHTRLGMFLLGQGDTAGAAECLRRAARLTPGDPEVQNDLGLVLRAAGDPQGAVAASRRAAELAPDRAIFWYNLGVALNAGEQPDEAAAAYYKSIRLDPSHPESYCNLGHSLRDRGRFRDAVEYLKKGHERGTLRKGWNYPSGDWVRQAELLLRTDEKLGAVLARKARPADAVEALNLATVCLTYKKRYANAADLFATAFEADASLAADVEEGYRARAAGAAVRAASGDGVAPPPDVDRPGYRAKALRWLRADLEAWSQRLARAGPSAAPVVYEAMGEWVADPNLATVRNLTDLLDLPTTEALTWAALWADVGRLHDQTRPRDIAPPPRELVPLP